MYNPFRTKLKYICKENIVSLGYLSKYNSNIFDVAVVLMDDVI